MEDSNLCTAISSMVSTPLTASPPAPRPSWLLLGTEPLRATSEYLSHRMQRALRRPPRQGDGHPVIVFPGLASDGNPVAPLVDHCKARRYQAMDWGRGFNTGPGRDVDAWLRELASDIRMRVENSMQPGSSAVAPTLIGWSLGGIYARELAKLPGMKVRQVITIGTPFNGNPAQTHAGWLYRLLNGNSPDLSLALRKRLKRPPPVPTTSIYSRSDGVVAWQACSHDEQGARVQDIEVQSSHLGMGWNPAVLRLVSNRLAQPSQGWRRYRSDAAAQPR